MYRMCINIILCFGRQPMEQRPMYPKHLVYPSEGVEVQLEMIRAQRPIYRERMTLNDSEDNGVYDMDMTEAIQGNITLNIPVMSSVERGRTVNVLIDKRKYQPRKTIPSKSMQRLLRIVIMCYT